MTVAVRGLEDYPWGEEGLGWAHQYLLPELEGILDDYAEHLPGSRALDLGSGNGAVTDWLADRPGIEEVVGVEPSEEGVNPRYSRRADE